MESDPGSAFSCKPSFFSLIILTLFGLYLAAIAVVNHANFNTNASDYAYYLHQLNQLSQFRVPHYTLATTHYAATWGDHFEPTLFLAVLYRYLFGTYSLALVQIGMILFGAMGVRRLVARMGGHRWLPDIAMAHFLGLWGIHAAVSFDFHMNVVGTMLVPWIMDAFVRQRWAAFYVLWVLFLGCSETFGFWGCLIGTGLAWEARKQRTSCIVGLVAALCAASYQIVVLNCVIPQYLHPGANYVHFRFHAFGPNLGEALKNMLIHPWDTFRALFSNHLDHHAGHYLKAQFYLMAFLGGAVAMLWRPAFLWMTLPLLVIKMLSDKVGAWGLSHHYNVVFVPFFSLALFRLLSRMKSPRTAVRLAAGCAVLALSSTLLSVPWRTLHQEQKSDSNLFNRAHWRQTHFEKAHLREALALIPDDANVSASSPFTPHLALRDTIRMFPLVPNNTEFVLVLRRGDTWPAREKTLDDDLCQRYLNHVWWDIIYDAPPLLLLQNRVVSRRKGRTLPEPNLDRNPKPL